MLFCRRVLQWAQFWGAGLVAAPSPVCCSFSCTAQGSRGLSLRGRGRRICRQSRRCCWYSQYLWVLHITRNENQDEKENKGLQRSTLQQEQFRGNSGGRRSWCLELQQPRRCYSLQIGVFYCSTVIINTCSYFRDLTFRHAESQDQTGDAPELNPRVPHNKETSNDDDKNKPEIPTTSGNWHSADLFSVFVLWAGRGAGNPRINHEEFWYRISLRPHPSVLQYCVVRNCICDATTHVDDVTMSKIAGFVLRCQGVKKNAELSQSPCVAGRNARLQWRHITTVTAVSGTTRASTKICTRSIHCTDDVSCLAKRQPRLLRPSKYATGWTTEES